MKKKTKLVIFLLLVLSIFSCGKKYHNELVKIGDKYTYYGNNGEKVSKTWRLADNKRYYFDENGETVTGWKKLDNLWYYFDENGAVMTGWQKIDNKSYYFGEPTGEMKTGWILYFGWNYLGDDGAQQFSTWVDNKYYLDSDGKMLTNTTKNIDGVNYTFDENGNVIAKQQVTQNSNSTSGKSNNADDLPFKDATNSSTLNQYFSICKDYYYQMCESSGTQSYAYAIQLKNMVNTFISMLEASYQIDSMTGNSSGVMEEKIGYATCQAYMKLAREYGAY